MAHGRTKGRSAEPQAAAAARVATDDRGAVVLWGLLLVLALARAASAFLPSTWAWGLAGLRFAPATGWVWWALGALALLPAVSRATGAFARGAVNPDVRSTGRWAMSYVVWAAIGVALVLALPDRLNFSGDPLMRSTPLGTHASVFATLHPHALPLDALLHDGVIRFLGVQGGLGVEGARRILGALEAGALGALAVHFARVAALDGAAALAATGGLLGCGLLILFTGYAEAFGALGLATVAVGVFALDAVRSGRGLLRMGIALAVAVLLHPLGFALVLPCALAWWRARRVAGSGIAGGSLIALAVPLVAIAATGYRTARLGALPGTWSAPSLGGAGAVDLVNVLLFAAPLLPLFAIVPLVSRHARRTEFALMLLLALPLVAGATLFLTRGPVRTWDALLPAGAALAMACAWIAGETLRSAPAYAGLALAVALGTLAPTAGAMIRQSDVQAGLQWVEAFARERPVRSEAERAAVYDFLGLRQMELGRAIEAASSFSHAAELTPSPRILRQWALTEGRLGHPEVSRDIYEQLLERFPEDASAWLEYAKLSAELGDVTGARAAAGRAVMLRPGWPPAMQFFQVVGGVIRTPGDSAATAPPSPGP